MIPDLDLLGLLRDAHPPSEPFWWPPAPGWWLVVLLGVALAALAIRRLPSQWRRWRMRRHLLATLDGIAMRQRAGAPADTVCADVSALLRLAAILRYPDRDVAGLHGREWMAFLDSCDRVDSCDRAPGRFETLHDVLTVAPYAPLAADVDARPLLQAARGWLRTVL